jgi:hypothetical protein
MLKNLSRAPFSIPHYWMAPSIKSKPNDHATGESLFDRERPAEFRVFVQACSKISIEDPKKLPRELAKYLDRRSRRPDRKSCS